MTPTTTPGTTSAAPRPVWADVTAVVLDVGETLVDESRLWLRAAQEVGVTPLTLMAVLGALTERGEPHHHVWEAVGVEPPTTPSEILPEDLYPDALPALGALRAAGYVVAVAGNQPARAEQQLREAGVEVDMIATSARWGVAKPSPAFFARVVTDLGLTPADVLYVGDRLDNDVLPARALGMRTAFVRRGPWGHVQARRPDAALADVRVGSLRELAARMLGVG
ncbi:hydrolase, HAD-superfamily, subfamily IIIA [Cellulomonas flavigena DSM 20109]|uniref:Hydrolase, HAD-superfamily, subfamily IIIA n=1 Tax=Cellulomonas flavigena (strain ATCC 482 / DSM 20109 / BCRC 11376 / JCM 18109 / NBRC 3775 / NCIMB 8073 / NRS 134) TaxID=446466 RepID=D5UDX7_CELFN|nr:HAD family hydrolase [Cellulomonas flavigena]ADG74535.1 hydrolase, HAD-superfamily, subfamily IIIA [Cellulomonas flavigena DSM 20109]